MPKLAEIEELLVTPLVPPPRITVLLFSVNGAEIVTAPAVLLRLPIDKIPDVLIVARSELVSSNAPAVVPAVPIKLIASVNVELLILTAPAPPTTAPFPRIMLSAVRLIAPVLVPPPFVILLVALMAFESVPVPALSVTPPRPEMVEVLVIPIPVMFTLPLVIRGAFITIEPAPAFAVNIPPDRDTPAFKEIPPPAVCMVKPPLPKFVIVAPELVTIAPVLVALSVSEFALLQEMAFCTVMLPVPVPVADVVSTVTFDSAS